jgi:ribosome-associated toxin RatA of RatAB toxin-antitoxin module
MRRIARSAIVECSAESLYALVSDVESYPEFLPWCAAAHAQEKGLATLVLGVKGMRHTLTTQNLYEPGRSITMRLVEGPFRHFLAEWRFTPLGDSASKAEFSLEYEFSSRLLAGVLGPVLARMADSTVDAFVRRAAARRDEAAH